MFKVFVDKHVSDKPPDLTSAIGIVDKRGSGLILKDEGQNLQKSDDDHEHWRRMNLPSWWVEENICSLSTVFENHRKSLIQHYEQSELRLHFEWTKVNQNCQSWSILASFWKPEACGQTVLPDRSVLIGQKLVENANIQKFKCDILSNF